MRAITSTTPEAVWRAALQARGREWVAAELKRLPGQPRDPLLDVVFEEPYPSREFCHRWCAEEENRFHPFSWSTVAAGVLLVLVITCLIHAVSARRSMQVEEAAQQMADAPVAGLPPAVPQPAPPTNDIPTPSGIASPDSSNTSPPSICAYQSFATAQCPAAR
ncbi:MAG TPA: hypothetical protein VH855_12815 [Acetobacteraceae bacterium]